MALGFVISLISTQIGLAITYPVSSAAQFDDAANLAVPGDEILWQPGTYQDVEMVQSANFSGAIGNPITITAETPGTVIFSGASRLDLKGSHLVIENLVFCDGAPSTGLVAVDLKGTDCILRDCDISAYNRASTSSRVHYVRLGKRNHIVENCNLGPRPPNVRGNLIHIDLKTLVADFHVNYETNAITRVTACIDSEVLDVLPPSGSPPYNLTVFTEVTRLETDIQALLEQYDGGTATVIVAGNTLDISIRSARIVFLNVDDHDFEMSNAPSNHIIRRNRFTGYPSSPTTKPDGSRSSDYESIQIGDTCHALKSTNTIVEENVFQHCDGGDELITVRASDAIIRRNSILECRGALSLRHGINNEVSANYFLGNQVLMTGGVLIFGANHKVFNNHFQNLNSLKLDSAQSFREVLAPLSLGVGREPDPAIPDPSARKQIDAAIIAHNTLVLNRRHLFIGNRYSPGIQELGPKNSNIANNLVWGNAANLFEIKDSFENHASMTNLTWEGNLLFGSTVDASIPVSGYAVADPQLTHDEWVWRLNAGVSSPAKDASVGSYPKITHDIDGEPRDTLPDIGADEIATAPVFPLLHPSDTGTTLSRTLAAAAGSVEFTFSRGRATVPSVASSPNSVTLELHRYGGNVGPISAICTVDDLFGAGSSVTLEPTTFQVDWADGESGVKLITVVIDPTALAVSIHPLYIQITSVTGGALTGVRSNGIISSTTHTSDRTNTVFPVASQTEFDEVISVAMPGDTIEWTNGVYSDIVMSMPISLSGTAAAPLTITAQTPGEVIFTGTTHLVAGGDYLVIDGLTFRDGRPSPGIDDVVELKGSHCLFRNCEISNVDLALGATRVDYIRIGHFDNTIEYCTFKNRIKDVVGNMITVETETLLADYHLQYAATSLNGISICDDSVILPNEIPGAAQPAYNLTSPTEIARLQSDIETILSTKGNGNGTVTITYLEGMLEIHIESASVAFTDADGHPFTVSNPLANHVIRGNRFMNYPSSTLSASGDGQRANGHETIRIGNACNAHKLGNILVENNYFFRCDGEDEMVSMKASGMTLRENTIVECRGGVTFRQGEGNSVESNYFIGNRLFLTGGVRVFDRDHIVMNNHFQLLNNLKLNSTTSFREALAPVALGCGVGDPDPIPDGHDRVQNALVVHNTFALNRHNLFYGAQYNASRALPPDHTTMANNLIWGFNRDLLDVKPEVRLLLPPLSLTWNGNILFGSGVDSAVPATAYTLADPKMIHQDWLWNVSTEVPSSAQDASVTAFPEVVTDIDGQLRDSTADVGANELFSESAPAVTSPLLQINEVGSLWSQTAATDAGLVEFTFEKSHIVIPSSALGVVEVRLDLQRYGGSSGSITATCEAGEARFGAGPAAISGSSTFTVTWEDGDQSIKSIIVPVDTAALMQTSASGSPASALHPLFIRITGITGGSLPGIRATACVERQAHPYVSWASALMGDPSAPLAQPSANFDHDDNLNGLEFALAGGHPSQVSDRDILPEMHVSDQSVTISFRRNLNARGLLYEIQKAPTPAGPWTTQASLNTLGAAWDTAPDISVVQDNLTGNVDLQWSGATDEVRGFWRLGVVLTNPAP